MGCHFLLQGIFLTQGLNPGLLHCRQRLYHLSHQGSLVKAEPDVKNLGEQLQGGQIEKVILQAEKELSLTRKMVQWKPWDPLVKEPPANQWKWVI